MVVTIIHIMLQWIIMEVFLGNNMYSSGEELQKHNVACSWHIAVLPREGIISSKLGYNTVWYAAFVCLAMVFSSEREKILCHYIHPCLRCQSIIPFIPNTGHIHLLVSIGTSCLLLPFVFISVRRWKNTIRFILFIHMQYGKQKVEGHEERYPLLLKHLQMYPLWAGPFSICLPFSLAELAGDPQDDHFIAFALLWL